MRDEYVVSVGGVQCLVQAQNAHTKKVDELLELIQIQSETLRDLSTRWWNEFQEAENSAESESVDIPAEVIEHKSLSSSEIDSTENLDPNKVAAPASKKARRSSKGRSDASQSDAKVDAGHKESPVEIAKQAKLDVLEYLRTLRSANSTKECLNTVRIIGTSRRQTRGTSSLTAGWIAVDVDGFAEKLISAGRKAASSPEVARTLKRLGSRVESGRTVKFNGELRRVSMVPCGLFTAQEISALRELIPQAPGFEDAA